MNIRNAKFEDVDRINDIHNQAINEKFKVAYLTPWTNDMMLEWLKRHDSKKYPALGVVYK
jgi:L-amino acid N-acyltransferase YncA